MQPRLAVLVLADVVLLTTASRKVQPVSSELGSASSSGTVSELRANHRTRQPLPSSVPKTSTLNWQCSKTGLRSLADMTKEELLARFSDVESRWGRYAVSGDTLSRTYIGALETPSSNRHLPAAETRL